MSRESINFGKNSLIIDTNSGQVISWENSGYDILYKGSSDKRSGIPILFPFADPLKNNTLDVTGKKIGQHGFARNTKWKIVEKNHNQITIAISNNDIDQEFKKAYPYKFNCSQNYLLEAGKLIYTINVHNFGDTKIPIAPGIHPYFNIKHIDKKKININNGEAFKGVDVNWEQENTGHFIDFQEKNIVDLVDYKVEISELSKNKSFENLVIWSQPDTKEDSDFVCIEPFTRKTNGINNNPIIVNPGGSWEAIIKIKYIPSI